MLVYKQLLGTKKNGKREARLRSYVKDHPNIIKAVKTLGRYDLLFYIVSASSKEFHKTVKEIKQGFPAAVKNYDTFVAFKEHVYRAVPKILSE